MFDPDPQLPILRLAEPKAERPLTTAEVLEIRERQMEDAIKAWVSATIDYAAERKQAQPISAVRDGNVRF